MYGTGTCEWLRTERWWKTYMFWKEQKADIGEWLFLRTGKDIQP